MTASYVLQFSDPNNLNTITVLPVPQGPGVDIDSTSLTLVGSGYPNYGLPVAQNFLKLLENFASPNQPLHPIKGQLWYDTSNPNKPVLRVNNGKLTSGRWPSASGIYQQTDDPILRYTTSTIAEGDIWVDTAHNQLKIRYSNDWTVVGPSVQSGTTKSGSEAVSVESVTGDHYPVIKNWVEGHVVEIISYTSFTPRTVIDGFSSISIGTNLTSKVVAKYHGLAEKASALEVSPGVLITANQVLKNSVTSQTHTGTLYVESINGLNVRPNSTSRSIKIYSNLTNSAFVDFLNTDPAATFRMGIGTSSYITFNSGFASLGINKSPVSSSPALDVNGGARFLNTLTITTSSRIALSVGGGASFGNDISTTGLRVSGQTTSTGKLTLGASGDGTIIEPSITDQYDIGSSSKKFRRIYGGDIYAINFNGNVTGSATSLSSSRDFKIQGQITATVVTFNGTANAIFATSLTRDSINAQTVTETPVGTHTLLVLNTATTTSNLEKISKKSFLSDVYPNIIQTGMILPFGTSTNIPSGFLVCDGVAQLIVSYPDLYTLIGTTYGAGGAGTFRTPNMSATTQVSPSTYITYIIKT
jgi:hypothetical protein